MKYGTDGWRGRIAEEFTFSAAEQLADRIAAHFQGKEIFLGHDARFLSPEIADAMAGRLTGAGVSVRRAAGFSPTPACGWAIGRWKSAGGLVVTASHNTWEYNGVKIRGPSGRPFTDEEAGRLLQPPAPSPSAPPNRKAPSGSTPGKIREVPLREEYLSALSRRFPLPKRLPRFSLETFGGSATGWAEESLRPAVRLRSRPDPYFYGRQPEPIPPHLDDLARSVRENRLEMGLALDGDGDRLGAVDRSGNWITPHEIFSAILLYRLASGRKPRGVARTFSTTDLIDRICQRHGVAVYVTPIGFKHISPLLLERKADLACEESGGIAFAEHLPERDGIAAARVLLALTAAAGPIHEQVRRIQKEYGPSRYLRRDWPLKENQPAAWEHLRKKPPRKILGRPVKQVETLDGIKIRSDSAWLLLRPSGTEPLVRIYAEAPEEKALKALLAEGRAILEKAGLL